MKKSILASIVLLTIGSTSASLAQGSGGSRTDIYNGTASSQPGCGPDATDAERYFRCGQPRPQNSRPATYPRPNLDTKPIQRGRPTPQGISWDVDELNIDNVVDEVDEVSSLSNQPREI